MIITTAVTLPVFHTVIAGGMRKLWKPATINSAASAGMGTARPRRGHQHDPGDEHAGEDVGPARLGAGAHDQRSANRPAGRNAADKAGGHVGDALPQEVSRDIGVFAVRYG